MPVAHDPELRGDAACAFHARRQRRRRSSIRPILADWPEVHWTPSPSARRVDLDTLTPRGSRELEARRDAAAQRQACSPAATPRTSASPICSRAARRCRVDFTQPRHLLRRAGRSGARRSRRSRGPDDRHAHGQVHRDDAREDRPARAWSARPSAVPVGDRGDPQASARPI